MAAISAPYCGTTDVAFLLSFQRGGRGEDYKPTSSPSDSVVDFVIESVASRIDMAYSSVGYTVPFEAVTGTDWPTAQTNFLKYFNAVGAAAFLGGNVPSKPVTGPGRTRPGQSLYRDEWTSLVGDVAKVGQKGVDSSSLVLLRAQTRSGTGAEWNLSIGRGMTTNFLEGYYDPSRYDMLHKYTLRMKAFYEDMDTKATESPDYMWIAHNRLGFTYDA
jgi:hypothetical protein